MLYAPPLWATLLLLSSIPNPTTSAIAQYVHNLSVPSFERMAVRDRQKAGGQQREVLVNARLHGQHIISTVSCGALWRIKKRGGVKWMPRCPPLRWDMWTIEQTNTEMRTPSRCPTSLPALNLLEQCRVFAIVNCECLPQVSTKFMRSSKWRVG